MRLSPTFDHPCEGHYRRPGGPWDIPRLGWPDPAPGSAGIAVVDGTDRLGHGQVADMARRLANGLKSRGVGQGDVVAWQMPNWQEALLLYRACWLLGAIAVPLGHRLRHADLKKVVDLVEPALTLSAENLALHELRPGVVVRGRTDGFTELLEGPPVEPVSLGGHDLAVGMLTSGSTGESKVVLHSHRALSYKSVVQQTVHALTGEDVVLMPAPLSHVTGLVNGVVMPAACGMRVVLMDVWDPSRALDLIEEEHVTFLGGPAAFLTAIVQSQDFAPERVSSLRIASMGGSSMTPAALGQLAGQLTCTLKRTYGMTEAATITTLHEGDPEQRGWDTDGRVVGQAEIRIVDPTSGEPAPDGVVGEVWIRGPEMFAGYALAAQTAETVAEGGWLRTGDLGRLDGDGWLRIAGRIKEMIIRGGENIIAAEVEGLLESHPHVRQAVAVGYPDRILGERVAAVVVAGSDFDVEACRAWFTDMGVAKFKTPEAVVHVEEIPLLPTAKPDRAALKAMVAEILARNLEGNGG